MGPSLPRVCFTGALACLAACLGASCCDGKVAAALTPEERQTLAAPDQLEVLSLDPDDETGEQFHGARVLGSVPVNDRGLRRQIVSQLERAISRGDRYALCFERHHGLRARRGAREVDVLICYTCAQLALASREGSPLFPISDDGHALLDRILRDRHIPLRLDTPP